jgi:hypothetical protein
LFALTDELEFAATGLFVVPRIAKIAGMCAQGHNINNANKHRKASVSHSFVTIFPPEIGQIKFLLLKYMKLRCKIWGKNNLEEFNLLSCLTTFS